MKPEPERRVGWRARYVDPDSGRTVKETLDATLTTAEARDEWAVRKSKALAKRRLELEGGALPTTGTTLADAADRYFKDHPHLKPATSRRYRDAADKLIAFLGAKFSADDLTAPKLVAFRTELTKQPRASVVRGGKRGERRAAGKPRSAYTINGELLRAGTVLNYLRRLGLLPRLTGDALADAFQKHKVTPKRIHYLKPAELQRLLYAGIEHDAERFAETRAEHAGQREKGSTPRYTPIAPVLVTALITGLRFGHLLDLEWSDVDLDALDHDGNPVGEITPQGGSHTKRTGVIGLEISPGLRALLEAMRPKNGEGRVFAQTRDEANAALRRLVKEYDAPSRATWQAFRRTCGCYLTNAAGIFGAASAYRSAKQLGHSVTVAEKHYVDVVRGIPPTAKTVEAAMQIEPHVQRVIDAAST